MGYGEADMRVWNPHNDCGGLEERDVKDSTLLLWKGHCSVHQRFRPEHAAAARAEYPGVEVIVHPECAHDLVEVADRVGSTERIQEWVAAAPAGAVIAVATEIHMVQRLAREHPDKTVFSLDPLICPCATMFRIDAPAPRVDARAARRRRGREPDRRRPRRRRVGPRRPPTHARHHLTPPNRANRRDYAHASARPSSRRFDALGELLGQQEEQAGDVGGVAVLAGFGEEALGRAGLLHALE